MNESTYLAMLTTYASMANQFIDKHYNIATIRMTLVNGRQSCTVSFNRDTRKFVVVGNGKDKLRYRRMQKEINDKFKEIITAYKVDTILNDEPSKPS